MNETSGLYQIERYSATGKITTPDLDHQKRHEILPLYKKYSAEEFPMYDNIDAINVDKTSDIPYDYDGMMGVPITFIDKYNPEQFELIGIGRGELGRGIGMKKNARGRTDLISQNLALKL